MAEKRRNKHAASGGRFTLVLVRRLLLPWLLSAMVAVDARARSAAQAPEYNVKAAYLFNFVNFTEWPPKAFATPSSPLRICILGRDPFGGTIDEAVRGESVLGHPLKVDRLRNGERPAGCHVVFLPAGVAPASVLRAVSEAPVLTIGESDAFWRAGGMLRFVVDGQRVRFDANPKAAEAAGLRLSARLLQVARSTVAVS